MKLKLEKQHWEQAKIDNVNLILQCKMQIQMAEKILVMVEEKLSKFPKEKNSVAKLSENNS
jgi:hypothetical protein